MMKRLKKLNTPEKIQDFLNALPFNFEKKGETYRSVERALEAGTAHCFEGALIAAYTLSLQGHKPLLLDLKTTNADIDHVVAPFKFEGYWGAISKTNHAVLRYREPIYKTIRELALSYFHEYFLPNGTKTLRSFSKPFNLSTSGTEWIRSEEDLFDLVDALDRSPHTNILSPKQIKRLRKADVVERKAGDIVEYKS